jgi:hypothetical protein
MIVVRVYRADADARKREMAMGRWKGSLLAIAALTTVLALGPDAGA